MTQNLLLVGCGKMGSALLGGYIRKGRAASTITAIEPNADMAAILRKDYGIEVVDSFEKLPSDYRFDIVQLSVKPQMMADVLPTYKEHCTKDTLFISIAAGKTIAFFEEHLGDEYAIVRVMPNLPALVNKGVTALYGNHNVSDKQKQVTQELFSAVGQAFWLEEENQMDSVTAVSGSGPAYVFHFFEALEQAALKLGLPKEMSKALAYSTIVGSAEMALDSEKTAGELREQVTSPKGTTEAGLNVLMAELPSLIQRTTEAAANRSKELAD